MVDSELQRVDEILTRGLISGEWLAYISVGGHLVVVPPRDSDERIVMYRLERMD